MNTADAVHPDPALHEKLHRLYAMRSHDKEPPLGIRPAYLKLLAAIGNPHHDLPPVIHIAGTNGKGSALAYIKAICQAAGYRVHSYTSPHLIRFNERITLAGQTISDAALSQRIDDIIKANNGADTTFFEITTAMALRAFADHPADLVLLETGMGGRLDCTNVIDNPAATIITPIGYDHMEFLGTTLPAIASEKAGIMKRGAPCIIGRQDHPDAVLPVFEKTAETLGCPLFRYGRDWRCESQGDVMHFQFGPHVTRLPRPCLTGAHQIYNAGTALAALPFLTAHGFSINTAAIESGLQNAQWPARLQNLPVPESLPGVAEIWVDGGHNETAAHILAAQIRTWQQKDPRPLHLIIGLKASKEPHSFLRPLLPLCEKVTFTSIGPEKSYDINVLSKIAHQTGALEVHTAPDVTAALAAYSTAPNTPARLLITGSLYLAGEVLRRWPAAS